MAIDFSFLEGATQNENTPTQTNTANVTIRVDAIVCYYATESI